MTPRAALLLLAESREPYVPAPEHQRAFLKLVDDGLARTVRDGKQFGFIITGLGRDTASPHRQQESR